MNGLDDYRSTGGLPCRACESAAERTEQGLTDLARSKADNDFAPPKLLRTLPDLGHDLGHEAPPLLYKYSQPPMSSLIPEPSKGETESTIVIRDLASYDSSRPLLSPGRHPITFVISLSRFVSPTVSTAR